MNFNPKAHSKAHTSHLTIFMIHKVLNCGLQHHGLGSLHDGITTIIAAALAVFVCKFFAISRFSDEATTATTTTQHTISVIHKVLQFKAT